MIVMRPAPVKNAGPPKLKWASVSGDRLQAGEKHASVHPSLRTGKPMLTSLVFANVLLFWGTCTVPFAPLILAVSMTW